MAVNLVQKADGSVALLNEADQLEVARFGGPASPSVASPAWRAPKIAKVPLAALDTGGGILAWANPEAGSILITRLTLDVTTKSTGACTADFGTTATSAVTSSDNLIDGVDVGTAAGVFDSVEDQGTSGTSRQKLASGKWVTGSMASGAAAGLVGFAYIEYVVI